MIFLSELNRFFLSTFFENSFISIKIFFNFINEKLDFFFSSNSLLNSMQLLGLAFLTVMIPLGINVLGKRKDSPILYKYIILDHIIKAKYFILYILMVYIPLFFWDISSNLFKVVEITIWFFGIFLVFNTMKYSYRWIKGNKDKFIKTYLIKLENSEIIKEVWPDIWDRSDVEENEEIFYFDIFKNLINKKINNIGKNNIEFSTLIKSFLDTLDKRTNSFLIRIHPIFYDWNFILWKTGKDVYYENIYKITRLIEESLKSCFKLGYGHTFFNSLQEHIKDKLSNNDYLSQLFRIFYGNFFENIGVYSKETPAWEDYFPNEWKITKSNYQDINNLIFKITFNKFMHFAQDRILEAREELDKDLDELTRNLFPDVDPITWSRILIFVLSGYDPDNRVNSIIKRPWNFGFIGRVRIYWGNDDGRKIDRTNEINNTLEFALILFPDQFNLTELNKYLKEIENLKYDKGSKEDIKRKDLLMIFKKMKQLLK